MAPDPDIISKRTWIKLFDELSDRANECRDRYIEIGCSNADDETKDYCAERASEYDSIIENNKRLYLRVTIEDKLNIYAVDEKGTPLIMACTPEEYRRTYTSDGNVRLPSYII